MSNTTHKWVCHKTADGFQFAFDVPIATKLDAKKGVTFPQAIIPEGWCMKSVK